MADRGADLTPQSAIGLFSTRGYDYRSSASAAALAHAKTGPG